MTPERTPLLRASSCPIILADPGSPTDNHSHELPSGSESNDAGHHHRTPQEQSFPISLTLENTGSVARDHLASERTFLAYVRTSLAMSAAGVALVQLFTVSDSGAGPGRTDAEGNPSKHAHHARLLAGGCILLGLYLLLFGTFRFFTVQAALVEGKFPATRVSIVVVSVMLIALIATPYVLFCIN